jgi:predicted nuclease with RNAse H fold
LVTKQTRVLGIDLGGASSDTTGYALLGGADKPRLLAAGTVAPGSDPQDAEAHLLGLIDGSSPDVVAIDAPLTLPPCLTCPSYCRGPGELCELPAAREMWAATLNPVSQRLCERVVREQVGERPLPTMQLGVVTGRAVALARCLSSRGTAPSVIERGEVLEVYPRATLRRLSAGDPRLAPRIKSESPAGFRERVLEGFAALVGGLDEHAGALAITHTLDALVAAYTGWLAPDGLEPPPDGFNVAAGWIWFPRRLGDLSGIDA